MKFTAGRAFLRGLKAYVRVKLRLLPTRLGLVGSSATFKKVRKGNLDLAELAPQILGAEFVIEVGANSGSDSVRMLETFPGVPIICFEPDPRAIAEWRRNVCSSRAELREIAVSNHVGTVLFNQSGGLPPGFSEEDFPDGWHLSGSVLPPKNHTIVHGWSNFDTTVEVPCETLDYALSSIEWDGYERLPIGLVWADVQGAEAQLIEGARETLDRTRFFYTEYSNDELYEGQVSLRELLRMLPGFKVAKIWTNDVLLQNKKLV